MTVVKVVNGAREYTPCKRVMIIEFWMDKTVKKQTKTRRRWRKTDRAEEAKKVNKDDE